MAEGLSTYAANAFLNAIGNDVPFSISALYVKLHTGAPGAAGTSNAAAETTRKSISFAVPASGSMTNDVAVNWTTVAGSETYTKASVWDAASGGNFIGSGSITSTDVDAGDNFSLPIGDLLLGFTVAS